MDVAIIGAGVSGCYCAYRLAESGQFRDANITVFEASDRVGGRLFSMKLDGADGSPIEFGGMFFGSKHETVFSLVNMLGLERVYVDWSRRHQFVRGVFLTGSDYANAPGKVPYVLAADEKGQGPSQLLMAKIYAEIPELNALWPSDPTKTPRDTQEFLRHRIVRGRVLSEWGFWNLLSELVSNEAYELLLASSPSASTMRNQNAYDAILTLLFELKVDQDYWRLTDGYQALPETLLQRAQAKGASVDTGCALKRVALGVGKIRLYFTDQSGFVETDRLILALPKRALEKIEFGEGVFDERFTEGLNAVMPVPACKLFLAFENSWWSRPEYDDDNPADADIALSSTDLPMRKCYYFGNPKAGDTALLLATYADDAAASFWKGLRGPDHCSPRFPSIPGVTQDQLIASEAMVDSACAQLQKMHKPPTVVSKPKAAAFWDWSDDPYGAGWHSWKPHRKSWQVAASIRQPNPALPIFVCGEAFATPQGWVEGAINNAESMLEMCFGLTRPTWVRPEHEFEIEEKPMSKLYDFLLKMSKDRAILREFALNSRAVMDKEGLSAEEQDAILSGSLDQIYAVAGSRGFVICKDIWIFDPDEELKAQAKKK